MLDIRGTDGDDQVIVTFSLVNPYTGAGSITVTMNGIAKQYDYPTYSYLQFQGFGGNDRFENQTSLSSYVYGGTGDDTLIGGSGMDQLFGQDDNDDLRGGDSSDYLWGAAGDDTLMGGDAMDQLFGEEGNDSLSGGDGSDYVWGGADSDSLYGDEGADRLFGEDGLDKLFGGSGADRLDGGGDAHADELWGEGDRDTFVWHVIHQRDAIMDYGKGTTADYPELIEYESPKNEDLWAG
jgi:Ca2+-binding RTX toxin-like protein